MIFEVGDIIAHKTAIDDPYLIVDYSYVEKLKVFNFPAEWYYTLLRLSDGCYYKYKEESITPYSVRIA